MIDLLRFTVAMFAVVIGISAQLLANILEQIGEVFYKLAVACAPEADKPAPRKEIANV